MTAEARSLLDLTVLLVLALAALLGAASGALRQLVSLAAAVAGVLAARAFAKDVGDGLARTVSSAARPVAPVLLFFGVFALVSLVGGALLRATGMAKIVRGPTDRAAGALLGGAKGALAAWVLLSAFALAREHLPARAQAWTEGSDFAAVARAHNLVARLDPGAARRLERPLEGLEKPLQGLEKLDQGLEKPLQGLEKLDRKQLEGAHRRSVDELERLERAGREGRGR